jgi:hypothetical protein
LFEDHPAALKLEVNKKAFLNVALIFFASVFWIKPKNEVGLGRIAQYKK